MMIFNHISFPFSLPSKLLRVVFRMIRPVFKPQDHLVNFIVDWDSKQGSHANPKILSTPIAGHPTSVLLFAASLLYLIEKEWLTLSPRCTRNRGNPEALSQIGHL